MNNLSQILQMVTQAATATGSDNPSLKFMGIGLSMLGCLGTSIGQGIIGGKAVEALSRNPEISNQIFKQYIISAAICESAAIYALIIAIALIAL